MCGFVSNLPRVPAFLPDSTDLFSDVAERVKGIPTWVFHGDQDEAVSVDESRQMVSALKRMGADVRHTEFSGVGHGAWDPAHEMPELTQWMFGQQRGK